MARQSFDCSPRTQVTPHSEAWGFHQVSPSLVQEPQPTGPGLGGGGLLTPEVGFMVDGGEVRHRRTLGLGLIPLGMPRN